jgi:hypothetical protein
MRLFLRTASSLLLTPVFYLRSSALCIPTFPNNKGACTFRCRHPEESLRPTLNRLDDVIRSAVARQVTDLGRRQEPVVDAELIERTIEVRISRVL